VLREALVPRVVWSTAYWATLVGILGTTISPYLFFWQAAQEVEQKIALGDSTVEQREGASQRDLRRSRNECPDWHLRFATGHVPHHSHFRRNAANARHEQLSPRRAMLPRR